jgi:predicted nucleotidyltransferase
MLAMDEVMSNAALDAYASALQARFGEQLVDVWLFGSRARGDAHPDSDIDVLVVLDDPDTQALSEARACGFDILLTHDVFLSIRAMSRQQLQELAELGSLFYRAARRCGSPSRRAGDAASAAGDNGR